MSDETTELIVGDAVVSASESGRPRKRRWFERKRKVQPALASCENCAAPLAGPYCAQCGQHAIDYRRSFGRVFLDVLDSFLNWDSKFFATIGLLLIRPWRLTNDFVSGKRVRYVHPLRLYLLVSIGFFFAVHELAKTTKLQTGHRHTRGEMPPAAQGKLDAAREKLPVDTREEVRLAVTDAKNEKPFVVFGSDKGEPASRFEKWMNERVKTKIGENGINARVFFLTLTSNLPAMMLCCIPLFAFVLKVLYVRRHVLYIDHLIYSLHIHAFAYCAIMIVGFSSVALKAVSPGIAGITKAALILAAIALLFVSIRRVYRQSWFMSVMKFAIGGFAYLMVLSLALAATFFITLAMPD